MNNKNRKIISAATIGTTAMTLYSYSMSGLLKQNFREPQLLAKILNKQGIPKLRAKAAGWLVHYAVGVLFTSAYSVIWRESKSTLLRNSMFLGLASGVLAAGIWRLTLEIQPVDNKRRNTAFYRQLIFAHIIFTLFSRLEFERLSAKKDLLIGTDEQNLQTSS